ncbi:geranylgeranyl diphosphate synthase type II [Microterricola gilva]|uniref:Geranylgeranyl diphosphate synthase type II n=1 Tax=Microterricola gilva TaxID=393267 RepID=A0A4Q8ASB4_9MICO|nr:polyprenyl synthetase family protein [Microterricola gilva]RZU66899.1 geranylgeranyl diphosphate synthase type II [Microterricola gilva]
MTAVLTRFISEQDAAAIESRLAGHWARRIGAAAAFGADYEGLWSGIARSATGGKLLRPALVLGVHEQLGGGFGDAAVEVAVAFELLHTGFLVHDDVIDRDLVRRGRRNILGERVDQALAAGIGGADAERWAQASAILAGDLLIHDAQGFVARVAVPEPIRIALLELLDEAVFASAAGELADVALSAGTATPGLHAVLDMTTWKTAPYSFSAPLRAGAILASAPAQTEAVLARFGSLVGRAFQLRDDLLGVFGDEAVTGKSTIGDIREGKVTAMIAYARETQSRAELRGLLGGDASTGDVARLRSLLVECGAVDYVEGLIAHAVAESLAVLDAAPLPDALRTELARLSHQATERVA